MKIYTLDAIIDFGRYKDYNYTLKKIIDIDLNYIEWCVDNVDGFNLNKTATQYLEEAKHQDNYEGWCIGDINDNW